MDRRYRIGEITGPPDDPAERPVGPFPGAVVPKPVMGTHMKENRFEGFGKQILVLSDQVIGMDGKIKKGIAGKNEGVHGKKMVIGYIHKYPAIPAISRAKNLTGPTGGRVQVGELVDCPMHQDPATHIGWVFCEFFSLDKIPDHIADQDGGVAKGKVGMGKEIHGR